MIGISEYIERIYEEFSGYYDKGHRMCALKELASAYKAGEAPDYQKRRIQQLYLLKYAYLYSFEYFRMYEKIIGNFRNMQNIRVVSLGCGAMIDYWSLVYALKKHGMGGSTVYYTGVDQIDWNDKIKPRKKDKIFLCSGYDIKDFFANKKRFIYDIYFFPKSICEFGEEEMSVITEALSRKPIKKNTIYLCVSIRKEPENRKQDMEKTRKIVRALKKNHYLVSSQYITAVQYMCFTENKRIEFIDRKFVYPKSAEEYLKHLNEKCEIYLEKGRNCKGDCEERLARWPMLKTGNICYQVIKLDRK